MFKIGDCVRHKTGITGKVIGYGKRQLSDSYYTTTLKVELRSDTPIVLIRENVVKKWKMCWDEKILACTLPHFPKRSVQAKSALV